MSNGILLYLNFEFCVHILHKYTLNFTLQDGGEQQRQNFFFTTLWNETSGTVQKMLCGYTTKERRCDSLRLSSQWEHVPGKTSFPILGTKWKQRNKKPVTGSRSVNPEMKKTLFFAEFMCSRINKITSYIKPAMWNRLQPKVKVMS